LDLLWALLLIGAALFIGGILLRSLPTAWLAFGAVLVVFGLGIPALVIDDHKSESSGGGGEAAAAPQSTGGTTTTTGGGGGGGGQAGGGGGKSGAGGTSGGGGGGANAQVLAQGKQLFQQNCGTCHTLADAGTSGKIGPVLDDLKPDKQVVLGAIKNGGAGSGTMPANIVTGKDADAVATYVSTVAGQ
jgi:mono/diheme cytochrome c family protein